MVREKVLREETAEYTCDCNIIGRPYRWVKQGDGEFYCPFCDSELNKDKIVHRKITYQVDEDGFIVV